jgi:hypothetical protein
MQNLAVRPVSGTTIRPSVCNGYFNRCFNSAA